MINAEASRAAIVASRKLAAYGSTKPKEVSSRAQELPVQSTTSSTPSSDKPASELKPSDELRVKASDDPEKDPSYDPLVEQRERQRRLSEIAESMSKTLQRITHFFKPEDLAQPPGPIEIQRRVSEASNPQPNDPKSRALSEATRKQDPNLRSDIEKEAEGSPLNVVV